MQEFRLSGAADEVLPAGVELLVASERVFEAMLEGWRRQQASRHLKADTIRDRLRVVQRMHGFTDSFPWQWTPQDGADFSAHLANGISFATLQQYQSTLKLFQEYGSDPRYGWIAECLKRFGHFKRSSPMIVCRSSMLSRFINGVLRRRPGMLGLDQLIGATFSGRKVATDPW